MRAFVPLSRRSKVHIKKTLYRVDGHRIAAYVPDKDTQLINQDGRYERTRLFR